MDKELIRKYGSLNIEELLTKLEIMREALQNISKHQALVGGSLSKFSATKHIADKALKDAGFSND